MPLPDELVVHVRATWHRMAPLQQQALRDMFTGQPPAPASGAPLAPPPPLAAAAAAATAEAPAGAPAAAPPLSFVESVVAFNAFGDEYEDLAAAQLRGQPARSHVGLWQGFNLFNHSCAPNCVHYVVGDTMVVRAVQVSNGWPAGRGGGDGQPDTQWGVPTPAPAPGDAIMRDLRRDPQRACEGA